MQLRSCTAVLLWLWRRLATVAPIPPLAWELLYAAPVSLKRKRKKKKMDTEVAIICHKPRDAWNIGSWKRVRKILPWSLCRSVALLTLSFSDF